MSGRGIPRPPGEQCRKEKPHRGPEASALPAALAGCGRSLCARVCTSAQRPRKCPVASNAVRRGSAGAEPPLQGLRLAQGSVQSLSGKGLHGQGIAFCVIRCPPGKCRASLSCPVCPPLPRLPEVRKVCALGAGRGAGCHPRVSGWAGPGVGEPQPGVAGSWPLAGVCVCACVHAYARAGVYVYMHVCTHMCAHVLQTHVPHRHVTHTCGGRSLCTCACVCVRVYM